MKYLTLLLFDDCINNNIKPKIAEKILNKDPSINKDLDKIEME